MTSAIERHAELIDKGWTVRLDGKWRPPNPADLRVCTFAAAWKEHVRAAANHPATPNRTL